MLKHNEITYDLLWAIFPPNEILLAPKYDLLHQMQALIHQKSEYAQRENRTRYFGVQGHIVTHDGEWLGYAGLSFEIDEFLGSRKITDLSVFPLKYDPKSGTVRQELIARGKKYLSIVDSPRCLEYTHIHAIKEIEIIGENPTRLVKFGVSISFSLLL